MPRKTEVTAVIFATFMGMVFLCHQLFRFVNLMMCLPDTKDMASFNIRIDAIFIPSVYTFNVVLLHPSLWRGHAFDLLMMDYGYMWVRDCPIRAHPRLFHDVTGDFDVLLSKRWTSRNFLWISPVSEYWINLAVTSPCETLRYPMMFGLTILL